MGTGGESLSAAAVVSLIVGLVAIGGVILAAGAALARLSALGERVASLEKSRTSMGERLGALETKNAVIEHEVSRPYRTGLPKPAPRPRADTPGEGEGG